MTFTIEDLTQPKAEWRGHCERALVFFIRETALGNNNDEHEIRQHVAIGCDLLLALMAADDVPLQDTRGRKVTR
jgi:hypothetical protein